MDDAGKSLRAQQSQELLQTLQARFGKNMARHKELDWARVQAKLQKNGEKLWALAQMEATGGEPDLIGYDEAEKAYVFCDCAPESPTGRRNLCYDDEALNARKEHKPKGSAVAMAAHMGIEMLHEAQYRALQELGEFDLKISSWIATPEGVRQLGGALFADRRYNQVFVYHNGAESYYGARGFRGMLKV